MNPKTHATKYQIHGVGCISYEENSGELMFSILNDLHDGTCLPAGAQCNAPYRCGGAISVFRKSYLQANYQMIEFTTF